MRAKDALGRYGEEVAARHLQEQGLVVVERNWRCASGEIDIVCQDGDEIVFCEVKTRSSDRYGVPAEAVTDVKARRLRGLALRWLEERRPAVAAIRFDVVSVLRGPAGAAQVEHLRAAF